MGKKVTRKTKRTHIHTQKKEENGLKKERKYRRHVDEKERNKKKMRNAQRKERMGWDDQT